MFHWWSFKHSSDSVWWFKLIFLLNSMLAWTMKSDFAIKQIEKWSYDYIKMDCEGDKCYGILAVSCHRVEIRPFELTMLRYIA
jgi:hypothetical protein